MTRIENLRIVVKELYEAKHPDRDQWADWLYKNHVFVVSKHAKHLAKKYAANEELCEAAAILHDIADAQMSRDKSDHEQRSLDLARELLESSDYSKSEIEIIVDDACRWHSCRPGNPLPATDVGKILATADALAHIENDKFYAHFKKWFEKQGRENNVEKSLEKLNRDYHTKILFEEIKEEYKSKYENLVKLIRS